MTSATLKVLQFGDSMFPVGACAFSNGLEMAVQNGVVRDRTTLEEFVRTVTRLAATGDGVALLSGYRGAAAGDLAQIRRADEAVLLRKLNDRGQDNHDFPDRHGAQRRPGTVRLGGRRWATRTHRATLGSCPDRHQRLRPGGCDRGADPSLTGLGVRTQHRHPRDASGNGAYARSSQPMTDRARHRHVKAHQIDLLHDLSRPSQNSMPALVAVPKLPRAASDEVGFFTVGARLAHRHGGQPG
jgi:hypothetical protein